jgi:hypothetical protein
MLIVRYFDLVLILAAAPIMLLIGVPALGYGVGVGAWIVLRLLGAVVGGRAAQISDPRLELPLRLGYMIGRLFALAMTVIIVRNADGQDSALTALFVIVAAFTTQLVSSIADRPRSR